MFQSIKLKIIKSLFVFLMLCLIAFVSFLTDKAWYHEERVMLGVKWMIYVRNAFVLATYNYIV